ncbi:MAG: hypothetical protein K2G55_10265, partial [Lachnospiraceae bacterium]|nr:hypothetical protein [Lachnospiraceae bacterium]
PYGKNGDIAKKILDEKKITSYILADHYKCSGDSAIYDIDVLYDSQYKDYKILLLCDPKSAHYDSVKSVVSKVEEKMRIIEML